MRKYQFILRAVFAISLSLPYAHAEEEESASASVGPEKGITEANETQGFKLSPEALKNFKLTFSKLTGDGPWTLPKSAILYSGEEVNLYRLRGGFLKRIDFQMIRKMADGQVVDSDDLREGDEVVTSGIGFVRTAELAASGGVSHGHSH